MGEGFLRRCANSQFRVLQALVSGDAKGQKHFVLVEASTGSWSWSRLALLSVWPVPTLLPNPVLPLIPSAWLPHLFHSRPLRVLRHGGAIILLQ